VCAGPVARARPGQGPRRVDRRVRAHGSRRRPHAPAGRARPRLQPLRGPRRRHGADPPGRRPGPSGPRPARGRRGRGRRRQVAALLRVHPLPPVPGSCWPVLEANTVSSGKATLFLPLADLLRGYFGIDDRDDLRTVRAKVTGTLLTLDRALEDAVPALLWILDVPDPGEAFLQLEPPQRRRRAIDSVKRVLLRESQVQPLLLLLEDLHWIDTETQAVLDSLAESLGSAAVLLAVNYRPEYRHGWGSKTYYRQLRLDPLPPESADALAPALLR